MWGTSAPSRERGLGPRVSRLGVAVGSKRRQVVGTADRLAVGNPGVLIRRPRIQATLHHPQPTGLESRDRSVAVDLERRSLLRSHGPYEIAHLTGRGRAFLDVVRA